MQQLNELTHPEHRYLYHSDKLREALSKSYDNLEALF